MEKPDTCNCCEGLSLETPVKVFNRPGLNAVSYRVGDYARFRESLLTRLSKLSTPQASALRQLTTRNNDDFTIALLDAWAVVSDVLTFYQERIANEAFLGTATEQISIVELARLIGYELRPGVAASTLLAFTMEEASMAQAQAAVTGVARGKEENPPVFIDAGTRVQSIPGQDEEPQNFETVEKIEARAEWNAMRPRQSFFLADASASNLIAVKGVANDLKAGDLLLFVKNGSTTLRRIVQVALDENVKNTLLTLDFDTPPSLPSTVPQPESASILADKNTVHSTLSVLMSKSLNASDVDAHLKANHLPEDDLRNGNVAELSKPPSVVKVFVFRRRAAVFGHNAPKEMGFNTATGMPTKPSTWVDWTEAENAGEMFLDTPYEQLVAGSYIAVQKPGETTSNMSVFSVSTVEQRSRAEYGISSKSTFLTFASTPNWWGSGSSLSSIRPIAVYVQSEELTLAELPIEVSVRDLTVELPRLYLGLKKGSPVVVSGERSDLPGIFATEVKILDKIEAVLGRTVLTFDTDLAHSYLRKTVTINANVAKATHGESVREVLGNGDATQSFQKFALKQPPLTFVSAATPSGGLPTLEIRVNDLLWHEAPSLYGRGATERIYITRQDDRGKTTVIFGDGKNGARLPTGQENVRATYRKGIGNKGLLKANQLSQLVSRPLGVKAATNPLPPAGAQDGEQLAAARRNATLTIFTLGRVVSLKDYEDFARAFSGIAKSLATWTWSGQRQEIYLTVAGANGADVKDTLYDNLLNALRGAGIPGVPLKLVSYESVFFQLWAKVQLLPDFLPEKVLADLEKRLREHFSFSAREFGQPVTSSEVVSVIQNTAGVQWLDLDKLFTGDIAAKNERLASNSPQAGDTVPVRAQLLTLDARPIQLTLLT